MIEVVVNVYRKDDEPKLVRKVLCITTKSVEEFQEDFEEFIDIENYFITCI